MTIEKDMPSSIKMREARKQVRKLFDDKWAITIIISPKIKEEGIASYVTDYSREILTDLLKEFYFGLKNHKDFPTPEDN